MAVKEYSTFLNAPGMDHYYQIVKCHIQDTRCRVGSYSSSEVQSVYYTAPADRTEIPMGHLMSKFDQFLNI